MRRLLPVLFVFTALLPFAVSAQNAHPAPVPLQVTIPMQPVQGPQTIEIQVHILPHGNPSAAMSVPATVATVTPTPVGTAGGAAAMPAQYPDAGQRMETEVIDSHEFDADAMPSQRAPQQDMAAKERPLLPRRSFSRFALDSHTIRGFYASIGTAYSVGDDGDLDTDLTTLRGLLAFGTDKLEVGAILPYHNLDIDGDDENFGTAELDGDGIGDLRAYAKLVPIRTGVFDFGGGVMLTFPTGDSDNGLGSDEFGFLPFATMGVGLGVADLRGHAGYGFFADSSDQAPESFIYGGGVHVPVLDIVSIRGEVLGESVQIDNGPDKDFLSFDGGFDVRLPLDGPQLILRPTVSVGLSDDAPDWGVGAAFAIAFEP